MLDTIIIVPEMVSVIALVMHAFVIARHSEMAESLGCLFNKLWGKHDYKLSSMYFIIDIFCTLWFA